MTNEQADKILEELYNKSELKKDYINRLISSEPRTGVYLTSFINELIVRKKSRLGESYGDNLKTLIYNLDLFSNQYNVDIFTNSITEEFLDDFIIFLESRNLKKNYIQFTISSIQSIVRKAGVLGYAVDPTFENVKIKQEEPFSIYLSMNEITWIYRYQGLTKFQERVRDLFIIGCLTGLRYSDYSTLTKDNFINGKIVKITKKTKKKVVLPIHYYVQEIIDKYEGTVPQAKSIQHFNRCLKMIGEKIGFNEPVTSTETRGGKIITTTKPKWEYISSHTARRSAATNLYLTGRFRTHDIMSLTGHTTEESFFRYIKITTEDTAEHLQCDHFFKK